MKFGAWKCTMELKFAVEFLGVEDSNGMEKSANVLYQKWFREQNMFGSPSQRPKRQIQWRPVRGQPFATDILKDDDE